MCTHVGYAASDEGGDPEFVPLAERLLSYQRRSVRLRRRNFDVIGPLYHHGTVE